MKYYSCTNLQDCSFIINGHLDSNEVLGFCCERHDGIRRIPLCETPEQTAYLFFKTYEEINMYSQNLPEDKFLEGCRKCKHFKFQEWEKPRNLIKHVNFSAYPAPCQCKCIYCGVRRSQRLMKFDDKAVKLYDRLINTLKFMTDKELISPSAKWKVASGEITIHPMKTDILNLVRDKYVGFSTNAFIFDEEISEILLKNPRSSINLSIDAGTAESWKRLRE